MLPTSALHDTVVCLAPGPSLTAADVDRCRGCATIIAINDAVDLAPWADVCYSSDTSRWWPGRKWLHRIRGPARAGAAGTVAAAGRTDAIRIATCMASGCCRNTGDTGLELARNGLRTLKNSGGAAINLAVHLGARRIVLVGYDMQPGHYNTKATDGSPYPLFRERARHDGGAAPRGWHRGRELLAAVGADVLPAWCAG